MELQIFKNNQFGEIRTVEVDGKIYFVGNDVARALGYSKPNNAITRHCKGALFQCVPDFHGIMQDTKVIPEGDIYRLIAKSKLPGAEKFESWVFDEVLPAVRKHGGYLTAQKVEDVLLNPDTIIQLATQLKSERAEKERLLIQSQLQAKELKEQAPKVEYYEEVLQSESNITTTIIAKELGMSAETLNKKLHEMGVIYRSSDTWVLYSKYHNLGYTHTKTFLYFDSRGVQQSRIHTYWTEIGRKFIHDLIKKNIAA